MEQQEPSFEKVCRDFFNYMDKEYIGPTGDINHPTLIVMFATPDNVNRKLLNNVLISGHKPTYRVMFASLFRHLFESDDKFIVVLDEVGFKEVIDKKAKEHNINFKNK